MIHTKANPAPTLTMSAQRVALFCAAEKCCKKTAEGAIGTNYPLSNLIDQKNLIMQNEPNFKKAKMNITSAKTSYYKNKRLSERRKNEPKTNPICRSIPYGEAGSNTISNFTLGVSCIKNYVLHPYKYCRRYRNEY